MHKVMKFYYENIFLIWLMMLQIFSWFCRNDIARLSINHVWLISFFAFLHSWNSFSFENLFQHWKRRKTILWKGGTHDRIWMDMWKQVKRVYVLSLLNRFEIFPSQHKLRQMCFTQWTNWRISFPLNPL